MEYMTRFVKRMRDRYGSQIFIARSFIIKVKGTEYTDENKHQHVLMPKYPSENTAEAWVEFEKNIISVIDALINL